MDIKRIVQLRGPNIWTNASGIEALVDLGKYEELPSDKLPGFSDRIIAWLPTMYSHRCTIGEPGGFFQRLRTGTWLGHVLEHVTIELHTLAGIPTGFGRARDAGPVVVASPEPAFATTCMLRAHALIMAAVHDTTFDVDATVRELRELRDDICLGPSTLSILDAADGRKIPHHRMSLSNSLTQLGWGRASRRVWAAETDASGAIASSLAQDKELTRRLMGAVGVPVPSGHAVLNSEEAWEVAEEIGLPVVVKPRSGNKGRGVSLGLMTRDAVKTAFALAQAIGEGVLVERHIQGIHHRVLVVGNQVVAASRAEYESVRGDGQRDITELVAAANRDPLRQGGPSSILTPIELDVVALELLSRNNLTPQSVPAAGQKVVLHLNGDLTVDETDEVHPDVAARCVLAARTVGLDIAGVDIVAEDVRRPLELQGGAVVEVNASPGLLMHLQPVEGKARDVGGAILATLFDENVDGRVPFIAVTGTRQRSAATRLLKLLLAPRTDGLGSATVDGLWLDGRCLSTESAANADSVLRLLINPMVGTVLAECDSGTMLEEGLLVDHTQVSLLTDFDAAAPSPREERETEETRMRAARLPLDVVPPSGIGVLPADGFDPDELAKHCKGARLYFAASGDHPIITAHLEKGGRAAFPEGKDIILAQSSERARLRDVLDGNLGGLHFSPESVLAACAGAWAFGMTPQLLESALRELQSVVALPPAKSAPLHPPVTTA
jgi:cyanophycin synthetase